MSQPTQAQRHNELLSAALAYAERGLYVVPLHEPLFDATGALTGCSCEAYKRSQENQTWLIEHGQAKRFDPNYKCRTPGKHPRLKDWETAASRDPEQIRKWWHKWKTANIGLAVGKSGLVTFDLDTYKEVYGDDDLFTQEDKQTATQISGGGGEHLVYLMPEGKAYTNANSTLPAGIDIRGIGGMQVVAPSMHPSGNLYEWEEGYSILERTPRPLPQALQNILDAAHATHTTAKAVAFSTPTTERIELIRWRLSKEVRALINAPGNGDRSKNDMKVCVSLCYAGATDDEILSVFEHYAIGAQGKYAEAGQRYLATTIGKARAFVELHPRPNVDATVNQLRHFITTYDIGKIVPAGPGRRKVRKVADAVFDLMQEDGRLSVNAGKKRLGKLAGVDANTAAAALALLSNILFDVTPNEYGSTISLVDNCRLQQLHPSLSIHTAMTKRGEVSENDKNIYSPHKASEPFLTGTSRYMRTERIPDLARELEITEAKAKADYTRPGLGEGVLLAVHTWCRIGDMTAQEYAAEAGIKLSSARAHLRTAVKMEVAEAEREGSRGPKVFSFAPDFWERIAELAPNLRTYRLSDQREDKRLEAAQQWVKHEEALATTAEETQKLTQRFVKLARQRVPLLTTLHPGLCSEDIKRLAFEVAAYKRNPELTAQIRTARTEARSEHRDDVTMIRELAESIADIGTPLESVFTEIMKFGVFDPRLVRSVLQSAKQMGNYETVEDLRKRIRQEDLALPHLTINTAPNYSHNQLAMAGAA